jgi:hypothetical protein
MTIVFRSANGDGIASGTGLTVTKPSGVVAGDWIIAVVHVNGLLSESNIADGNSGQSTVFTQQSADEQTDGGSSLEIWYRKADANDVSASDYTFTWSTQRGTLCIFAISGGLTGSTPWDITPSGSTGADIGSAEVNYDCIDITVADNSIHIIVAAPDSGNADWDTVPSGYTEIYTMTTEGGGETKVYYKDYATGGATAAQRFIIAANNDGLTQSFSFASDPDAISATVAMAFGVSSADLTTPYIPAPQDAAMRTETEKGTNVGTYDAAVRTEDEKEITENITASAALAIGVGSAAGIGKSFITASAGMAFGSTANLFGFVMTGSASMSFGISSADLIKKSPFEIVLSDNISASGEDTTNRLTTTVQPFGGGRIQDDENPTDAVDLANDTSGEWAWVIRPNTAAVKDNQYSFRLVLDSGATLTTYGQEPKWTVLYGDIVGTSTLVFGGSADLIGYAPISGTVPLVFGVSADLKGAGVLNGSTAIAFAQAADLKGAGTLAATEPLAIGVGVADLAATGLLSGASDLALGAAADLKGAGAMSATATMTFAETADLKASGLLTGTSPLNFSITSSDLKATGLLNGASAMAFDSSAFGATYNPISADSAMTFGATADLKGGGTLATTTPLVFDSTADLAAEGLLAGTSALALAIGLADLRNLSMRNELMPPIQFGESGLLLGKSVSSSTASMTFGSTADLKGSGLLAGTSPLAFDSSSDLKGSGILSGATGMTFAEAADLKASGALAGTSQITFDIGADLKASGVLNASSALVFGESADLGGRGVMNATIGLAFDKTADLKAAGALFGTAGLVFGDNTPLLTGSAPISATADMAFDQSGDIFGFVMTGSASMAFGSSADLKGTAYASATIPMTFAISSAFVHGPVNGSATIALAFDSTADLGGVGDLLASTALTLGVSVADLLNTSLYIKCTLVDRQGRGLPRLSDLSWAWFDETDPINFTTPTDKGEIEDTDGAAIIQIPLPNSTLDGGVGTLILRSDDGVLLGAYNMTTQY